MEYQVWGRPYDLRLMSAAEAGWLNMLHLHGRAVMFSELSDYPSQVVNWHDRESGPPLAEGARLARKVVCGGWEQWETMVRGDPARVREQARDAIRQMAGRNSILGTGCVVPIVAPRANLLAAAKAGGIQGPDPPHDARRETLASLARFSRWARRLVGVRNT